MTHKHTQSHIYVCIQYYYTKNTNDTATCTNKFSLSKKKKINSEMSGKLNYWEFCGVFTKVLTNRDDKNEDWSL